MNHINHIDHMDLISNGLHAAQFQDRQWFEWRHKHAEHTTMRFVRARTLMKAHGFTLQPCISTKVVACAKSSDRQWTAKMTFEVCPVVEDNVLDNVDCYTLELFRHGHNDLLGDVVIRRNSRDGEECATVSFSRRVTSTDLLEIYSFLHTMHRHVIM